MVEVLLGNYAETIITGRLHLVGTHNFHRGTSRCLLLTPVVEVAEGGVEVFALRGQLVFDVGRHRVETLAADNPSVGQLPQLIAQDFVGSSQLLDEFAGSPRVAGEEVQDHRFLLPTNDGEGVVGTGIIHFSWDSHVNPPLG